MVFSLASLLRDHSAILSAVIPFLVCVIVIRVYASIRASRHLQKSVLPTKVGYLLCFAMALTGFLFFERDYGLLPFIALIGWLLPNIVKKSWPLPIRLSIFILSALAVLTALLGIILGLSPMPGLGPSMWPASPKNPSISILDVKAYSHGNTIKYGDDVNVVSPGTTTWPAGGYRKRVWALSGDTLRIDRKDQIFLNERKIADCHAGRRIADDAWFCTVVWPNGVSHDIVWGAANRLWFGTEQYKIDKDNVFIVGDNTIESSDSRERGPVPIHWISGRYVEGEPQPTSSWLPWL